MRSGRANLMALSPSLRDRVPGHCSGRRGSMHCRAPCQHPRPNRHGHRPPPGPRGPSPRSRSMSSIEHGQSYERASAAFSNRPRSSSARVGCDLSVRMMRSLHCDHRSALPTRAGRMITAMDLCMTVLTGSTDHALALQAAWLQCACRSLTCIEKLSGMTDRWTMTLLTDQRAGRD